VKLVVGQDEALGRWAVSRIPHVGSVQALGEFAALGVADDERLLAVCIYHRWVPEYASCELTFAADSPRWATRGMVRGILAVPFVQYQCQRVAAVIPHDNTRAERMVKGFGFKREGCARRGFGGKRHALIYGLLRSEYDRMFKGAA
jgi:RimJ/RimL family protein N-acetyltransferase